MCDWKRPKINDKEARDGPFKKEIQTQRDRKRKKESKKESFSTYNHFYNLCFKTWWPKEKLWAILAKDYVGNEKIFFSSALFL